MRKAIIIMIIIVCLYLLVFIVNNNNYYIDHDIPIINIDLKDTNIDYINNHSKENKYPNNKMIVVDDKNKTKYKDITIKGRGNKTWTLDKKPYQISFEESTSILGLPKTKKLILLANAADSSLIKNDFSYSLAKSMNLNYSFVGRFVDLYIDKEYMGNYYITPKVSLNKEIINTKDDKAILVELDNMYYKEEKDVFTSTIFNDHLVLKDSNSDTMKDDFNNFSIKYNLMEEYIEDGNYEELEKIIDVDSFAKYYIISEYAENYDSVKSSLFFYMDGYNDKIHIGPIWDCDQGYGVVFRYSDVTKFPIKEHDFPDDDYSILFNKLLQLDEFNLKVKDIWNNSAKDIYIVKKLINYLKQLII